MLTTILRTLFLYITILLAIRLMGKRQIGDMQTSELVITLLISDIASIPMENPGKPLMGGFIPICLLVVCEILLSILMIKNKKIRRVVCGKPIVVIENGKICQTELKMLRMSIEDLFEQLRQNEVFSLDDVIYGIVETNGKLSILKKENNPQIPQGDMDVIVVSDGEISNSSCTLLKTTTEDIKKTIKKKHKNIKDIFLMTESTGGTVKITEKEKNDKKNKKGKSN